MSVSCSNYYSDSDLLCGEDSSGILCGESPECSNSNFDSSPCLEKSIAGFIEDERNFVPGSDYSSRFQSQSLDASAREESIAWILKVRAYYGFQPVTAYLSVNYMDRFLYSRRLPQSNGWPLQLLSVACLSLAAKMEEPLVPSLLDLQVEGAKYIFEPRTICRMELLVLGVLDWRLRSVTPFSFLGFFACKIDSTGTIVEFLIARSTDIILSNLHEAGFLAYWPSCVAATAILCAASELPDMSLVVTPELAESWCDGLPKDKIMSCYQLMQELVIEEKRKNPPEVLMPHLRVKILPRMRSSSSSFSLSSSSSSSPTSYKRRKLNNCLWVDDDK